MRQDTLDPDVHRVASHLREREMLEQVLLLSGIAKTPNPYFKNQNLYMYMYFDIIKKRCIYIRRVVRVYC